jgi:hypothetical protein
MRFLIKGVLSLVILGAVLLVGFAIFSDLPAPTREVAVPVKPQ